MAELLLVEDDKAIREALCFSYEGKEHILIEAKNIEEAKAFVEDRCPGLVLLDVSLPDGNGFDFYEQILQRKQIPTIFLTARDEENDIVRGLEKGAEDYITKPFSIKELMARVNRVLLRQKKQNIFYSGKISFDMDKLEVRKDGEALNLSGLEKRLILLLFENRNKVVTRNAIINCIWEATGNDVFDHTVTVYIKRIREKLGDEVIKTVKGIGYLVETKE